MVIKKMPQRAALFKVLAFISRMHAVSVVSNLGGGVCIGVPGDDGPDKSRLIPGLLYYLIFDKLQADATGHV